MHRSLKLNPLGFCILFAVLSQEKPNLNILKLGFFFLLNEDSKVGRVYSKCALEAIILEKKLKSILITHQFF